MANNTTVPLLNRLILQIISQRCFDKYLIHADIFDLECGKALLSKGLGLGIVAGSMLVKVPQIVKILSNKSGDGINVLGVFFDLFAITCHMSYSFVSGFPFSAWGDGVFLAFQTAMIAALVLHYGGAPTRAAIFVAAYSSIVYVLMGGFTPLEYLWSAQAFNVPVLFIGKSIQAITNYKNQSTGQLSAATCFMLFAGSIARIFTSAQETGDFMMILTYCVSTFANLIIVIQLFMYSKSKKEVKSPSKGEQKKKATKSKKAN